VRRLSGDFGDTCEYTALLIHALALKLGSAACGRCARIARGTEAGGISWLAERGESMAANKVLIAEDEPHIVESLSFLLSREGFDVSSAADGEAAFACLEEDPPDLMILDVMLPRMNGFEVLRRVRADPRLKALPVIMLTAKGQHQDRRRAEEIGADAFITKPFSNREVVDRVRALVAR
jgi:CheY-like chemotaxis protein